jgi:hypothetical protein
MIPADDVVQRIDDTLDDYVTWHGSGDAYSWTPDAEPGLSGDGGDPDRGYGADWRAVRERLLPPLSDEVHDAIAQHQVSIERIDETHMLVRPAASEQALELARATPWSAHDWQRAIDAHGHREDWPSLLELARVIRCGPRQLVSIADAIAALRPPPLRPFGITLDNEPDEHADPRQAALDARRNRNTGPQQEPFTRRGGRRG